MLLAIDSVDITSSIGRGEVLCVISAFLSALFTLQLEEIARFQQSAILTNALYLSFATILLVCFSVDEWRWKTIMFDAKTLLSVLYLGMLTFVGQFLQTYGQATVDATRTAVIFSLDPVYNLIIATVFWGEMVTRSMMCGVALVSLAVFV
tara:strand:+ start:1058 stop:1507 length:450 start_codon:yes stop_codon:yes gene_type:complete